MPVANVSAIDLAVTLARDVDAAEINSRLCAAAEGELADLLVWFDNEWGFANRMLDVANCWLLEKR